MLTRQFSDLLQLKNKLATDFIVVCGRYTFPCSERIQSLLQHSSETHLVALITLFLLFESTRSPGFTELMNKKNSNDDQSSAKTQKSSKKTSVGIQMAHGTLVNPT